MTAGSLSSSPAGSSASSPELSLTATGASVTDASAVSAAYWPWTENKVVSVCSHPASTPNARRARSAGPANSRVTSCVQPVQRPPQTVVIEVLGPDPRSQQVLDRFIREVLRDEVESAITEPQAIEHQRHGRRPHTDLLAVARLLLVEPLGHPDLPTDFGHDAQIIEMFHHVLRRHGACFSYHFLPVAPALPKWLLPGKSKLRNQRHV